MTALFQVTVTDEHGVVIDSGWVSMEVPLNPFTERPERGSELFDKVLCNGLDEGIYETGKSARDANHANSD